MRRRLLTWRVVAVGLAASMLASEAAAQEGVEKSSAEPMLLWQPLPDLPDSRGVAGAYVGVSGGALIVAGGTNFAEPVWESDKTWHDKIYVLSRRNHRHEWHDGGKLPRPLAGGAAVSTPQGLLLIGGCDADRAYADVHLLRWDPGSEKVTVEPYPPLPASSCHGQAALVGETVYLVAGQTNTELASATAEVWSLDLTHRLSKENFKWRQQADLPGGRRALHAVAVQNFRGEKALYVMGGRREGEGKVEFLTDTWQLDSKTGEWHERAPMPRPAAAAPAIGFGRASIYLLGGDDGSLFDQTETLRDEHPGFPREGLVYDTQTDVWETTGEMPTSQLATQGVMWDGRMIVASGETRPRERTPKVWSVRVRSQAR